jgi:hypothetical protein
MTSVYVAAPYVDAPIVRMVHERLRDLGITPTSRWAEEANGAEDFVKMVPDALRAVAESNDRDLTKARALLVLSRHGAGAETYAEARLALVLGKPVVWAGRLTLSAWRTGVTRVAGIDEGIEALQAILFPIAVPAAFSGPSLTGAE